HCSRARIACIAVARGCRNYGAALSPIDICCLTPIRISRFYIRTPPPFPAKIPSMDFLKTTAGRIISGIVALAVIAGGVSWWRMDESKRDFILGGAGRILGWIVIVCLVPWASFALIARVSKFNSNLAGGVLVAAYTALELLVLGWM